jgi:FAD/FMN-containing dehydrogenase
MQGLKQTIANLIRGEVWDDEKTLDAFSRDASVFEVKPTIVVAPDGVEDLSKLVTFVGDYNTAHQDKLSLTPRAAGTDMSGGPLTTSIALDMTRHFHRFKEIGSDYAVVEPGMYYRDFEKETLKHDLLMPAYTSSREICTVGGMVANNAGGEKSLTYGKVERYVRRLKVVLSDGKEYTLEPLSKGELSRKMRLSGLEGAIYRGIYRLVSDNFRLLQEAKPQVSKNSAGYALWNVWDGKTFDLTKLLVGSQGTLGIITEITFGLVRPKKHARLLVIFMHDLTHLATLVNEVLAFKPESFESYDHHTLKLALRFLPEIGQRLGKSRLFGLLQQFTPEFRLIVRRGIPTLTLLAEFTGDSEQEARDKAVQAQAGIAHFGLPTLVTDTKLETKKYWIIRRESFNLLRHHVKKLHTAPFIDDIAVRPDVLPRFLPELTEIMSHYNLIYTLAGHIGDGNFHIIPLMDLTDPRSARIIPELSRKVFALVFSYKGSMTGEHNDGLIRTPFLLDMYGKKVYALFAETKKLFDPDNIFNPGKKVNADMRWAMHHLVEG